MMILRLALRNLLGAGLRTWLNAAVLSLVFLAILKNAIDWIYGLVGMVVLAALIMLGIKVYKMVREREEEADS